MSKLGGVQSKALGILLAISVVLEAPFSATVTACSRELGFRNPVSETKPVLHSLPENHLPTVAVGTAAEMLAK